MGHKCSKIGKGLFAIRVSFLSIMGVLLIVSPVKARDAECSMVCDVLKTVQDSIVTGRVVDDGGKPLEGVAVSVVGTSSMVRTNEKGKFFLSVKPGEVLVFTLEGMQETRYTVSNKRKIRIRMNFDLENGDIPRNKLPGDEEVYTIVDEMPEFLACGGDIQAFLARNLHYPKEALDQKIQGKVMVSFIVTKTGHLANVRVIRSVHLLLDHEAMRVVKIMPKWKPGKQNGKLVNTSYTVPINFRL